MERALLRICGLTERQVLEKIQAIPGRDGLDIAVVEDCLDCKIMMKSTTMKPIEFATIRAHIFAEFEDFAYSTEEISLPVLAAELLRLNNKMLSVAESLTGGEICSKLCTVPGISENLYEGIVCYNRFSKIRRLGVSSITIAEKGAVSRETAYEMVRGLLKNGIPNAIGLATTGLAGPSADEGKPIGLVYIAVGAGDFITVFERVLEGDRNTIRNGVTNLALFYLIRYLH